MIVVFFYFNPYFSCKNLLKFRGFRCPGEWFVLYGWMEKQTHPTFILVPSEEKQTLYTFILVPIEKSRFRGSNPILQVSWFQISNVMICFINMEKQTHSTLSLVFLSETSNFCVSNPNFC